MSIEQIGDYNKLPSKDLRENASKGARAGPQKPAAESDVIEIVRSGTEEPDPNREASRTDTLDLLREGEKENPADRMSEKIPVDSLDLSWRDPESVQRIRELVEKIREYKSKVSERIEAARILIMSRAYDDAEQVRKTAEAVLRGESVDEIDWEE